MNWFETVKRYFDLGFYDEAKVKMFVEGGKITEEEYADITGNPYTA